MLPEELYTKIQKFHFRTKYMANDLFAGQYESAFKGRGMEFAEVREYQPGDNIRDIDWNVFARSGHPYVKVFHEERELTVTLLIDLSASNLFGTRKRFKREMIAEVSGLISFAAIRTNDRVGAVLFSADVNKYIPPQKGAAHVWRMIKEIFSFEPPSKGTNIGSALDYLNKVVKRHSIAFLVSDFQIENFGREFENPLKLASRKHDLTAIRVTDPAEKDLPDVGLVRFKDPETSEVIAVNTSDSIIRKNWKHKQKKHDKRLKKALVKSKVDMIELLTNGSVVEPMAAYFHQRENRR
ncbi:von Willebrand factor type A [Candidatus Magnetomoraceae bacterium gMMP-15]